jgi:hypothetical protein
MNLSIIETVLFLGSYLIGLWLYFTGSYWIDARKAKKKAKAEYAALPLKEKAKRAGNVVGEVAASSAKKVGSVAVEAGKAVGGTAIDTAKTVGSSTIDAAKKVGAPVVEVASVAVKKAGETILDTAANVANNDGVQKAAKTVGSAAKKAGTKTVDGAKKVGKGLKGAAGKIAGWFKKDEDDEDIDD